MVGESDEARQRVLALIKDERAALTERALEPCAAKLTEPPDTLRMIRELLDVNTFEGTSFIPLWRTGSASAHGHYWADQMLLSMKMVVPHRISMILLTGLPELHFLSLCRLTPLVVRRKSSGVQVHAVESLR